MLLEKKLSNSPPLGGYTADVLANSTNNTNSYLFMNITQKDNFMYCSCSSPRYQYSSLLYTIHTYSVINTLYHRGITDGISFGKELQYI